MAFARSLPFGALVVLEGPLGAGKTTFVKAMIAAMGGDARVTSPTYGLVHEIPTPEGTVVHADAYRLRDARDLIDLGLDEYLARARFVAVEWGAGLIDSYEESHRVTLERLGPRSRRLSIVRPVTGGGS